MFWLQVYQYTPKILLGIIYRKHNIHFDGSSHNTEFHRKQLCIRPQKRLGMLGQTGEFIDYMYHKLCFNWGSWNTSVNIQRCRDLSENDCRPILRYLTRSSGINVLLIFEWLKMCNFSR